MLTEKTFTVDGFSMNYAEGPENGPPLVFLHGATLWWKDFEPLFQTLEKSWHIYACDMRGHGKSSRTPGKYRAVDFYPDIVAFIQSQVREPVILVGHSNGGIFALLTAAHIPELVRAIILLDPATDLRNTLIQSVPGPGDWIVGVGKVLASQLSVEEFIREFNPEIDDAGLQDTESMIRSVDPEFVSVMLEDKFFEGLNLEEALSKVRCPTLLLYGELESGSLVPETEVAFIKQYVPQMIAHLIDDTGHSPHWEQTEITLGHIQDFLKAI